MGRQKLHERFLKADIDCPCEKCEKVRKTCRDCGCCSECCQCEYCELCGLPNGWQSECTCFQCEACYKITSEDQQALDNGDYENENLIPGKERMPIQYVCLSCYEKRKKDYQKNLFCR